MNSSDAFVASLNFASTPKSSQGKMYGYLADQVTDADTRWVGDNIHPLAFAAKLNDADTPNYREALNGPDQAGFCLAMKDEWDQLLKKETWDIVDRKEALDKNANIIVSTWVYKRKRFPDGSIRKLKARMCARGDQQIKNVDYFDTDAPVVSWSTVRTLLTISCVLGLETKQVDYTLAFCSTTLSTLTFLKATSNHQRSYVSRKVSMV
jgi:hypothetical protein